MNNYYIFVDGHVHFHDFPNVEQLFETVYSNFNFYANLSNYFPFLPILFVCNTAKAEKELQWRPEVPPVEGIRKLIDWIDSEKYIFEGVPYESGSLSGR